MQKLAWNHIFYFFKVKRRFSMVSDTWTWSASWLPALQTEVLVRGPDLWRSGFCGPSEVSVTDWCWFLLCRYGCAHLSWSSSAPHREQWQRHLPPCSYPNTLRWHAGSLNNVSSNHSDVLNNSNLLKISVIFKNNYRLLSSFETD